MPRGNPFGFDKLLVWRVTDEGLAVGQLDPANLTNGATSHAYECHGPVQITDPAPEYKSYEWKSGEGYEGKAQGGIESLGSGEIEVSQFDPALRALLVGGNLDTTTVSGWRISAGNKLKPTPHRVGMMAISMIHSRESATRGNISYKARVYPSVQMRMNDHNLTHQGGENPEPVSLVFEPQVVSKFPIGLAFGANQNWHQNSEYSLEIEADNMLALTAFIGDGTLDTYTVGYKPASTTVTGGNTNNWFAVDSVVTAPSSFSALGVVTLAAAPAAGKIAIAIYETLFESLS